jgi:hypothetical protein
MLASVNRARRSALLLESMLGEVLGDVALSLPEVASRPAWRSCCQMLRRAHAVAYPDAVFGIIVDDQIQTFADFDSWRHKAPSWGQSQIHMILDHFQRLPDLARIDEELPRTLAETLPRT